LAAEPTATTGRAPVDGAADDALTLHQGIVRRWEGDRALAAVRSEGAGDAVRGAERLIAGLPGLATLTGSFGPVAWDLATAIAENPQFLQRFSLDARAMSVAELADLVQLVLEAEKPAQDLDLEAALEAAGAHSGSTHAASATKAPTGLAKSAAPRSAQSRSAPTRSVARRAPAAGVTRKLATVKRLVAELRAAEVRRVFGSEAAPSGEAQTDPRLAETPGRQVGSRDPDGMGSVRPTALGAAEFLPGTQPATRTTAVMATSAGARPMAVGRSARRTDMGQQWLNPLANAADVAGRAPRALRMAESAAELAFLQPSAEGGATWSGASAMGGVPADGLGSESIAAAPHGAGRSAASPPVAATPARLAAGAQAARFPTQLVRPPADSSPRAWATAQGAQAAAPAAWARWVARGGAPDAHAGVARSAPAAGGAVLAAGGAALAARGRGAGDSSATAASAKASGAKAASAEAANVRSQLATTFATALPSGAASTADPHSASEPTAIRGVVAARASASPLAALTRSVAFAAQRLERWYGAQRPLQSSSTTDRTSATAAPANGLATAGDSQAIESAQAAGAARRQGPFDRPSVATTRSASGDRYAALFGAGTADVAALGQLLPRWTAWLARTDRAQQGRNEFGAGSGAAPGAGASWPSHVAAGYAASEPGAGDLLVPVATEAWAEDSREAEAVAGTSPASMPGFARFAPGRTAVVRGEDQRAVARPAAAFVEIGADRRAAASSGVPQWLVPPESSTATTAALARRALAGAVAERAQASRAAALGVAIGNAQAAHGDTATAGLATTQAALGAASGPADGAAPVAGAALAQTGWLESVAAGRAGAGDAALSAAGFAGRLSLRHLAGLVPMAEATRWLPASVEGGSRLAAVPAALGAQSQANETAAFVQQLSSIGSAAAAGRELRGPLAGAVGAGEYLVAGAEQPAAADGSADGASATDSGSGRAAKARLAHAASAGLLRSLGLPAAKPAPEKSVALGGRGAAPTLASPATRAAPAAGALSNAATAPGLAWTRAAAAAIDRIVAHRASARGVGVVGAMGSAAGSLSAGMRRSLLDFANGAGLEQLAARPGGLRDAVTPWLEQHFARNAPSLRQESAGTSRDLRPASTPQSDLIALQPDAQFADAPAPEAQTARAASTARSRAAAGNAAGAVAPPAAGARSATAATSGGTTRLPQWAAGLRDVREPAALRAALALFDAGSPVPAGAQDVARAFLSRWFGQAEVASAPPAVAAKDGAAQELLALRRGESWSGTAPTARPSTATAPEARAPAATSREEPREIVLTGLAALAALQQPAAERELGFHAQARSMRGANPERELLAPAAESGSVTQDAGESTSTVSRSAPPSIARRDKSTAVQLHEFAPVGLRRGRGLLGTARRAAGLTRVTPRGSAQRVGYGASALGSGEMVGLGVSDGDGFFGDSGQMPAALTGADRLSGLVHARRAAHGGRGHVAAVTASGSTARNFISPRAPEGAAAIPGDFTYGSDATLVNPAAALQSAVEESARFSGATASSRGIQAGAMARVLSVTSEPSANVLPLVAPAAHALVAAAAAKPLSESISTSGSDPTQGMPMLGQSHHGKGGSQDGHAAAEHAEQAAHDLDALAQKIARSVMVRVKKERERRGLHG